MMMLIHLFIYTYRTIATPGSLKDKSEKSWELKDYAVLTLVAGAVVVTCIVGYKVLKSHSTALSPGHLPSMPKKK
jgi:Ras family protein T1